MALFVHERKMMAAMKTFFDGFDGLQKRCSELEAEKKELEEHHHQAVEVYNRKISALTEQSSFFESALEAAKSELEEIRKEKANLEKSLEECRKKSVKRSKPKVVAPVVEEKESPVEEEKVAPVEEKQVSGPRDLLSESELIKMREKLAEKYKPRTVTEYYNVFSRTMKEMRCSNLPSDQEVVAYMEGLDISRNTLQKNLVAYSRCLEAIGIQPSEEFTRKRDEEVKAAFEERELKPAEEKVNVEFIPGVLHAKVDEWVEKAEKAKAPSKKSLRKIFAQEHINLLLARLVTAMYIKRSPVRSSDFFSSAVTETIDEECPAGFKNYFCLESGAWYLNDRKSFPTEIDVPEEFMEAVREFRELYSEKKIVLLVPNTMNEKFDSSGFTKLMKKIFGEMGSQSITSNFLRNCKASEDMDKGDRATIKENARISGHSVATRVVTYTKHSTHLKDSKEEVEEEDK